MNTLILLFFLRELEALRRFFLQKSNMEEHTFIIIRGKKYGSGEMTVNGSKSVKISDVQINSRKIRKIALPGDVSDETIKGVMRDGRKA